MTGQDIQISSPDGDFGGYLSLPPSGNGPGLVIIQEIFGVNQVMRDVSDFFAAAGFTCFCPDLFWRIEPGIILTDQTQAEWDRAFELFGQFDRDNGIKDIQTSLDFLRGDDRTTGKVGTVGYCLGGFMAYAASTRTNTDASVGYYGVSIQDHLSEAENIKNPLMLHIAQNDGFVPPEAQKAMHEGLDNLPLITLHDYEGQEHAFARPGGEHYDKTSADLANQRSIDFFKQHLS